MISLTLSCPSCGCAVSEPWRVRHPDGPVILGCVDACHNDYADAWHTRATAVRARRIAAHVLRRGIGAGTRREPA